MDPEELTLQQYEELQKKNPGKKVTLSPTVLVATKPGFRWKHVFVDGVLTNWIVKAD